MNFNFTSVLKSNFIYEATIKNAFQKIWELYLQKKWVRMIQLKFYASLEKLEIIERRSQRK